MMGIRIKGLFGVAVVFGVLFSLGVGCQTTGSQRAQLSRAGLDEVKTELNGARGQVVSTVNVLNRLVTRQSDDLRPMFDMFNDYLKGLETQSRRVRYQADALSSRAESHIAAWQRQLQSVSSQEIRARSAARQQAVADDYRRLGSQMQGLGRSFDVVMADLTDIETHLAADLTRSGVDSVMDLARRTNDDAKSLIAELDTITADIDALSDSLSPIYD